MSDTEPHVPDEDTQQLVGSMGNIYEENPMAQRELPLMEQVLNPQKAKAVDPSAKLDAAGEAAKAIDAGNAAPDHGKPAGAGNALTFHNWDDNADSKKSDQEND
jgi:hypothetical protein